MKTIYLAGGCFWGVEHFFSLAKGIVNTEVGYANGTLDNPKYEDLKHIIKETEDILSNAMANLTKSEQDFNTEIYNKINI